MKTNSKQIGLYYSSEDSLFSFIISVKLSVDVVPAYVQTREQNSKKVPLQWVDQHGERFFSASASHHHLGSRREYSGAYMMESTDGIIEEQMEMSQLEVRSVASTSSRKSNRSTASTAALNAGIKVEVARTHADYAKKESDIMIEKESECRDEKPITHVSDRTRQYVECQSQLSAENPNLQPIVHVLRPSSPTRERLTVSYEGCRTSSKIQEESFPLPQRRGPVPNQYSPVQPTHSTPQGSPYKPTAGNDTTNVSDIARYLARRDLVVSGLTMFDDSPEKYWAWKSSFKNIICGLLLSANKEMDLLIKWLGCDSAKHVRRIRAVHVARPTLGLHKAWERLEECFGSSEAIEKSLRLDRELPKDQQ